MNKSNNTGIVSIDNLIAALAAIGVNKGGGAITPGEAVSLINAGLGQSFWQHGISNAIFVNDFGADSADLSEYVATSGPNIGKWEIPENSLIVVNTARQSAESFMGREIVALGDLEITSSIIGLSKGIGMTSGVGDPSMTAMISSDNNSAIRVETSMLSDDVSRPAFNISAGSFVYESIGWALANPGTINCQNVLIDCDFILFHQSPLIIGENCDFAEFKNFNTDSLFLTSREGFDLKSTPLAGVRTVVALDVITNADDNKATFIIDQDNGENIGDFIGVRLTTPPNNLFIMAENDAAFNANPDLSVNFEFNVDNFTKTQRLAEIGVDSSPANPANNDTAFSAVNTLTDIAAETYILDQNSSGFNMPDPGELEYNLRLPGTYLVSYRNDGIKQSGGEVSYEFQPLFMPNGGSYAVLQIDDGVNQNPIKGNVTATPNDFKSSNLGFVVRFTDAGDRLKFQVKNLENIDSWRTDSIQWTVVRIG